MALANLGFDPKRIHSLPPGHAIIIQDGKLRVEKYAESPRTAHCFFEWIYFANVSIRSMIAACTSAASLGEKLAEQEHIPIDDRRSWSPCPTPPRRRPIRGLCPQDSVPRRSDPQPLRGRTFIEGTNRGDKAKIKYTPLREVLEGRKVFLVEDTIVRSTTMRTLITQLFEARRAQLRSMFASPARRSSLRAFMEST